MKDAGGFCLPDSVTKGVNIWFAIDNIDFLEDTPTGQETFHGTVIVINQLAKDGEPMNKPLAIPEKMPSMAPLKLEVQLEQEPRIKNNPLRFDAYPMGKRKNICQLILLTPGPWLTSLQLMIIGRYTWLNFISH